MTTTVPRVKRLSTADIKEAIPSSTPMIATGMLDS